MYNRYYQILGVKEGSSKRAIKQAYYLKAKQFHPDTNKNDSDTEKFLQIQEAFNVLCNGKKLKKELPIQHKYSNQKHTSYARMRGEMKREAYRKKVRANQSKSGSKFHRKTEYIKNEYGDMGRLMCYSFLLFLIVFGSILTFLPVYVLVFRIGQFAFLSSFISLVLGLFVLRVAYDWYNDLKIDFS